MSASYDQFFKKVKQNTGVQSEKQPVDISALAKKELSDNNVTNINLRDFIIDFFK